MAKPFELSIVSDVREVLKGNKDLEKSFDEVADSLDDLASDSQDTGRDVAKGLGDGADDAARDVDRATDKITDSLEATGDEAQDAGRDIGRHLEDGSEEAETAAERMERSFKEAFDAAQTGARTAGDNVSADTRRGFGDATEATDSFRNEAQQNLGQTFSTFRGDLEDIPQLAQDVLGGVSADLGPAGAIGSLIGAAGLGMAVAFYQNWKEQSENVEERISDMYDDMLESGNNFLSEQVINTGISEILNSAEDAVIDYAKAQEIAAATGLDLATVVRGYSGETEAAQQVQAALGDELGRGLEQMQRLTDEGLSPTEAMVGTNIRTFRDYSDTLDEVTGNVASAAERAEVFRDAQVTSSEAVRDHAEALAEWDDTLNEAREAIDENNESVEDSTQRGIDNQAVLAGLAGDMLDLRDSAREAGDSTEDLTAMQARQAQQFLDTAAAAGLEEDAALDLADQLGLIPADVITDIRENGADTVKQQAEDVATAAREAADGTYTLNFDAQLPARADLQWRMDQLAGSLRSPRVPIYGRVYNEVA